MSLHHRFKEMFLDFMTLYILPLNSFVPLTGHQPINSGFQHFTKTLPSFIRLHKRHVPLRYYVCAKLHLTRLAHYRVFDWRWFSEYQSVPILPQIIIWLILTYSIVPPWIWFVEYGRKSVAATPSVAPSIWGEISQLKIYILASSHSPEEVKNHVEQTTCFVNNWLSNQYLCVEGTWDHVEQIPCFCQQVSNLNKCRMTLGAPEYASQTSCTVRNTHQWFYTTHKQSF